MIIQNLGLKNKKIVTALGEVQFNAEGRVEVSDEQGKRLSSLNGFTIIEGTIPSENPTPVTAPVKDDKDDNEDEEKVEGKITLEEIQAAKNVPILKKIAKDNNIDVEGLAKKDEIANAIIEGLGL